MMFKLLYVYILKCADGSYYVGLTNDPDKRLEQHNKGTKKSTYTYSRRPIEMIYHETYWNFKDAVAREKQIKGWSKKKKEALIAENYEKLKEFSVCRNESTHLNLGLDSERNGTEEN
jgi:putative endonuclease